MTPDRIPTPEWDRVHELAVDIANASMQDDTVLMEAKTEEMLSYLRELRVRHGDLPSILGTLGDYTDDEVERYDLYARAVAEARRIRDDKNPLASHRPLNRGQNPGVSSKTEASAEEGR